MNACLAGCRALVDGSLGKQLYRAFKRESIRAMGVGWGGRGDLRKLFLNEVGCC